MLDVSQIRQDFPILKRKINGYPLVYLDNAATTQKPQQVIDTMVNFYQQHNANIHRGVHTLSEEATQLYDQARQTVADFINVKSAEIIFVRNATEAINLVAYSWGLNNLKKDDQILLSKMEHHSNLISWQFVAQKTGAKLRFIDIDEQGQLKVSNLKSLINQHTKLVSLVHVSNVLGITNPLSDIFKKVKKYNPEIITIADISQSISHLQIDPQKLHADFVAFSGHKMLAPMGIGVLWGKLELLEKMPPFLGGGDMISEVSLNNSTYAEVQQKFEAGTPNVAGAIGLEMACNYLSNLGMDNIYQHINHLSQILYQKLQSLDFVKIITPKPESGIVTFVINGVHAHDVAQIMDSLGVAVRSGQHCTAPLHKSLQCLATVRVSSYIYNDEHDLDQVIKGLYKVKQVFGL